MSMAVLCDSCGKTIPNSLALVQVKFPDTIDSVGNGIAGMAIDLCMTCGNNILNDEKAKSGEQKRRIKERPPAPVQATDARPENLRPLKPTPQPAG